MDRTVDTDESICYVIACAVSEFEERQITDLLPLAEVIDTDALESLVDSKTDEAPKFDGCIMFDYSDSHIAIWIDRSVTVTVSSPA